MKGKIRNVTHSPRSPQADYSPLALVPAAAADQTETVRGRDGAPVKVHRGNGCDGTSMEILSGRVDDPKPGVATIVDVEVDENWNVKVSRQEQRLPIGGPGDPGVVLTEVEGTEVAVFRFGDDRSGPLVPSGATVEPVDGTVGPNGIHGVGSYVDDVLYGSVMARDVPVADLEQLLRSGRNTAANAVAFDGSDAERVAAVDPSDVPGIGSIAVASSGEGVITSFTNNASRDLGAQQRAAVVAVTCLADGEVGHLDLLRWWYGVAGSHESGHADLRDACARRERHDDLAPLA